jgi:hypothetical protein
MRCQRLSGSTPGQTGGWEDLGGPTSRKLYVLMMIQQN